MKSPELSHIWDRHPDDWYVEPQWCSKRLFETHKFAGTICDPACGMGNIVQSARAMGFNVCASDIAFRQSLFTHAIRDWMDQEIPTHYDNIVSNPPFALCYDDGERDGFVSLCLQRAFDQVALLLPAAWVFGDKRSRWLECTPLEYIYYLTPRPSMPPGTVIEAGVNPGGGKKDFAWYVWRQGYKGPAKSRWLRRKP